MAQPPPTRLHIDPPIDQWRVSGQPAPLIATGHQPTLWHPGILAKDLALDALKRQKVCSAIHVVVDHNPVGPLALDVPMRDGDTLVSQRLVFNSHDRADRLPPNRLPPIAPSAIERAIESVRGQAIEPVQSGLAAIIRAYAKTGGAVNLAEQTTSVLGRLKEPKLHQHQGAWSTSSLVSKAFVDRLLADPIRCVRCYNRAAISYPEARIRTLYVGRDVIEVPLWAQDKTTVTPVYVDLGDSSRPQLFTTAHNQHLDLNEPNARRYLRPRAITFSAIMRSERCDLFIHGTGGGIYDQVTERWWRDWTGEALAPKAVVSADLYMPFDVPIATVAEHAKAQWLAHHLPHNVDRFIQEASEVDAALSAEKSSLLDHMNDDRDKRRRAKAFTRIHAINAELRERHARLLRDAQRLARDARVGIRNAAIAGRRDWCFALYPQGQIKSLAKQIKLDLM